MKVPVKMPKLGLTMSEGTIVTWFKSVGDRIEKGEALFEVMTEKITKEIESPYDGILSEIVVKEGETVPVGAVVGYMEVEGVEEVPVEFKEESIESENKEKVGEEEKFVVKKESEKVDKKIKISPRARKRAEELGIDISMVRGSGPGGRITEKDVVEFAASLEAKSKKSMELVGIRKIIASKMQESFRDKPHFSLDITVDASYLNYKKDKIEQENGEKISYTAMLIYYLGRVIKDYPLLNGVFVNDNVVDLSESVNVNVAVDTPSGLMVPVIKDIDKKDILQVSKELKAIASKARDGKLEMSDVEGGTITITNLGMFGIQRFTAVINPPQTAIIAVGAVENRVVALSSSTFAIKPMFTMTLTADHRVIDGAYGARFLAKFKTILEDKEA